MGRHASITLRGYSHSILLLFLHDQCINSIDRGLLNEALLDEASKSPNVRVFFQHKVQYVDFDNKVMTLRDVNNSQDVKIDFDFCVGADGSYSVVRRQMMKVVRYVLFRRKWSSG